MRLSFKHTLYACFIGYITQAIVSNLPSLLLVIFQDEFQLSLQKITLLLTIGFTVQICIDLIAGKIVDRFGYRASIIIANICCIGGLVCMSILPSFMDPFWALLIAISLNSIGGGFIEVVISPIVEALPGDEKAKAMSVLHSFYCWGLVGVVVLTTLYFAIFGLHNWHYLPMLWSIVPIVNSFLFTTVPIRQLVEQHEQLPMKKLLSLKTFWLLFALMICAGAAEQAMSKWSSLFAERGLGVSKTMGDLLGPCAFAILMGLARIFYSKKADKIDMKKLLLWSSVLCVCSYLIASLASNPILSLMGCALTGLAIGVLWPVTLSLSAQTYPKGGNSMFALLALGGDIGCAIGPSTVGLVSLAANSNSSLLNQFATSDRLAEFSLRGGLFIAIIFPIIIIVCVRQLQKAKHNQLRTN